MTNSIYIEITFLHNGTLTTNLYLIQGSSSGIISVGVGNEIVSFRVKAADCPGTWVDFDYNQYFYDFTNGCTNYGSGNNVSVGYNGHAYVGINCVS